MEALLSLAFDNLSSYDGPKIKKGIKQVDSLLAQICLSRHPKKDQKKDSKPTDQDKDGSPGSPPRRRLSDLTDDLAFHEFFKLQEGFEWNIALRLIGAIDRLMATNNNGQHDVFIMNGLDVLQGVLILHPPSKSLFSREQNMNLLLDLLEPCNCPAIQSATLLVLVVALIETPRNTRAFENLDGLLTITSLFKNRSTPRDVKLKVVEFLYFYLMPEVPSIPRADARDSVPAMLQRSPSKLAKAFGGNHHHNNNNNGAAAGRRRADSDSEETFTTEQKQALLGRHLNSVEELVKDLRTCTPFGGVVA